MNNTVKIKTLKQEFIYRNAHKGKFAVSLSHIAKICVLSLHASVWYNYPKYHIAIWHYNMHVTSIKKKSNAPKLSL